MRSSKKLFFFLAFLQVDKFIFLVSSFVIRNNALKCKPLPMTTSSNSPEELKEKPARLSRSERKALEREKKHVNHARKQHNYRNRVLNRQDDGTPYSLHSNAIPRLTKDSTVGEVIRSIKRAQNIRDHHDIENIGRFLMEEVDEGFAYGYTGSLLARLAVAALHISDHEIARRAINVRRVTYRSSLLPMESAALIRGLARVHNITDAMELLEDELSIPMKGTPLNSTENKDKIKYRASACASLASRHFFEGDASKAIHLCNLLVELGPIVREARIDATDIDMPWLRVIQGAHQCEKARRDGAVKEEEEALLPCNLVYAVLNAMATFPSDNDDRIYEAVSNALVRRTVFITGAVDMSGMPPADRGEVAFIGRSNVGKSSLVNMVTNRRSLAFTSKRPGKTQQFNFFAVNDKPEREREIKYGDELGGTPDLDTFYIVDLPGFGFAKVSSEQRKQWSDMTADYLQSRKTLKVVFHLVDSRHGPIDEDLRIMEQIGKSLPKRVAYVVVLTKADKNVKDTKKTQGRVSNDVMNLLRDAMKKANVGKTPVLVTSANTKMGRDDMWRYIKLAAEDN